MVILGLGSNVGDRLFFLRSALTQLKGIPGLQITAVSPVYISDALMTDDAPPEWNHPYLNLALRCETTLTPYELLDATKACEKAIGRLPAKHWAPRPIDIDILAWDDLVQYDEKLHIPHEHLHTRPFALWPLSDVAPRWIYPIKNENHGKTAIEMANIWGSRFSGEAPLHTRQIAQRIDTPQLMGVLNITPDSFSDGGYYTDVNCVIEHAHQLVAAGAEILDFGAEATNPNAQPVTATVEWRRLEEILIAVRAATKNMIIPPKISVDTRHPSTASNALTAGADWINDVGGLTDPYMQEIIAASHCDVVMMHQLGIPADLGRVLPLSDDPVMIIYQWAQLQFAELEKLGINKNRVIFDVGIGFGKTAQQSLEILQRFIEFKTLGVRLLVGHSRKSFQTIFTDKPAAKRDVETLPISLYLADLQTDYLRVHNVEDNARALKVAKAL